MNHSETRHLLYHLYPRKGSLWKLNVELLKPHLDLFNGKKIVYIATDDRTDDPDIAMSAFNDATIQFEIGQNYELRETPPFIQNLMPGVANETGITFFAHAKGGSYGRTDIPFIENCITIICSYPFLACWINMRRLAYIVEKCSMGYLRGIILEHSFGSATVRCSQIVTLTGKSSSLRFMALKLT